MNHPTCECGPHEGTLCYQNNPDGHHPDWCAKMHPTPKAIETVEGIPSYVAMRPEDAYGAALGGK